MNVELAKKYIASNDIFGLPQQYKGIDFYPIQIKNIKMMDLFAAIMTYPKNFVSDKEILKMSYLRFIISLFMNTRNIEKEMVDFFKHITKSEKVKIMSRVIDPKIPMSISNSLIILSINDIEITEWEFEELREIILEQNGTSIEYVNQYMPDLEEKLIALHDMNAVGFEDQIFTLAVLMKKDIREIGEYTIYQLQNIFERMVVLKQFDIYEPLRASGAIKLEGSNGIKHYFYHKEKKNRYGDILLDSDKFFERNREVIS